MYCNVCSLGLACSHDDNFDHIVILPVAPVTGDDQTWSWCIHSCILFQHIEEKFNNIITELPGVIEEVKNSVKEFQREFQLKYAELTATPVLDKVSAW